MSKKNKGIHIGHRKNRGWEVREYIKGKTKRYATGISRRKDAEEQLAEIILNRTIPRDSFTFVGEAIISLKKVNQRLSG